LREAQLASRLDHPYAAHVYAFGAEDEDGLPWIAMELVHGVTLRDWLETRGPMLLDQFVPFFECVAQVVQAAHEGGIVHRDLTPSNMMVIERGGGSGPPAEGTSASSQASSGSTLIMRHGTASSAIRAERIRGELLTPRSPLPSRSG
jgi:serine/threonine protein kinase